jgi:hypothetical protein
MYVFSNSNHKKEFTYYSQKLINSDILSEDRNSCIDELVAAYIEQMDQRPPQFDLENLANFILRENLTNKHPDKLSREDYPILSDRQQLTRKNKEFVKDESIIDYIQLKKNSKLHNLNKRKTLNTE